MVRPPFAPAPPGIDDGALLGAFGYDVSRIEAASAAFNRHFAGVESPGMTDEGRARLYCLVLKKRVGRGVDAWREAVTTDYDASCCAAEIEFGAKR